MTHTDTNTNTDQTQTVLTLPPTFYYDHVERGCSEGTIISQNKNTIKVAMTRAEIEDLLSDADYYSDSMVAREMGMPSLAASARRTIDAIGRSIKIAKVYNPRTYMSTWKIIDEQQVTA